MLHLKPPVPKVEVDRVRRVVPKVVRRETSGVPTPGCADVEESALTPKERLGNLPVELGHLGGDPCAVAAAGARTTPALEDSASLSLRSDFFHQDGMAGDRRGLAFGHGLVAGMGTSGVGLGTSHRYPLKRTR